MPSDEIYSTALILGITRKYARALHRVKIYYHGDIHINLVGNTHRINYISNFSMSATKRSRHLQGLDANGRGGTVSDRAVEICVCIQARSPTHSDSPVRRDANTAYICTTFASAWMLLGSTE
jgi:hypothetical protein